MPGDIVKLRGRGNYDSWLLCLQRLPDLTEQQTSMFFYAPINLVAGEAGHAKQYKDISFVYSTLVSSLDDRVCSGLWAHGQLGDGQKPWELYDTLTRYCKPTPSFAVHLINDLEATTIDNFTTPMEFAAYADFTRLCVEGDGYSMALTYTLFESVRNSYSEVRGRSRPPTKPTDWTQLLEKVRGSINHKKRTAEENSRTPEENSRTPEQDSTSDMVDIKSEASDYDYDEFDI
ncbi:hypothetical protein LX36DRAFT_698730 [Colletotrichum falcatum]|nr:hypothetical protein LX36DRAFT_698730 [Colletotrichum falcatum]